MRFDIPRCVRPRGNLQAETHFCRVPAPARMNFNQSLSQRPCVLFVSFQTLPMTLPTDFH
jgi:hypothetical protein